MKNAHETKGLGWSAVLLCGLLAGCGAPLAPQTEGQPLGSLERKKAQPVQNVDSGKSLMVTDLSVVEDPVRTAYVPGVTDPSDPRGVWSFGRLMENMAGDGDASAFTLNWLRHWESDQTINGFTSKARPLIRTLMIDPWRTASGCAPGNDPCQLNFAKAPFRLLAITNRLDLRDMGERNNKAVNAGEGRFTFGALRPDGSPLVFTVIFEYEQQAQKDKDVFAWADAWADLSGLDFGEEYNAALQAVTQRYAGRGVAGDKPNGSAINQIRTNEASLGAPGSDPANTPSGRLWEMREFRVQPGGQLAQTTVKLNPDLSFNGSSALGDYIAANEAAVISGKFELPESMLGADAATPKTLVWSVPGVSEAARGQFALATCSGCHLSETNTNFLHIGRRAVGVQSTLSSYTLAELVGRSSDLKGVLDAGKNGLQPSEGKRKNGKGSVH